MQRVQVAVSPATAEGQRSRCPCGIAQVTVRERATPHAGCGAKLATKAYHAKLERSAEFVVCFVPNEACYVAALDRDPRLLERGAGSEKELCAPAAIDAAARVVTAPELRVAELPARTADEDASAA